MMTLTRTHHSNREQLTLAGPGYSVTVEVAVSGLELSAAEIEYALHAALTVMADRGKLRMDAAGTQAYASRETI